MHCQNIFVVYVINISLHIVPVGQVNGVVTAREYLFKFLGSPVELLKIVIRADKSEPQLVAPIFMRDIHYCVRDLIIFIIVVPFVKLLIKLVAVGYNSVFAQYDIIHLNRPFLSGTGSVLP